MEQQEFDKACRFINALVAVVQRYGVSSAEMEAMLTRVARALHLRGQFIATPAQVQSVLWDVDEDNQRLHVSVASAGDYDLNKLAQVNELVSRVLSGDMTPDAGLERIRVIDRAEREYGPLIDALAFALCGVGFAVILGIGWLDVALGGALSLVSFGLARLVTGWRGLISVRELLVAAGVSALANALALVIPGTNPLVTTVCGVIFFVPGFGLTLGASELVNGNTLSGLIGVTRAMDVALKLIIGAIMGAGLVHYLASVPALPKVEAGVAKIWTWLFSPMLVLGLAILFRVRRRDLVWPLVAGLIVWLGVRLGAGLGYWQGTFFGALLLMLASRIFARVTRLPQDIILLPAVMLLVPGVAMLRAMYDAQTHGLVAGLTSSIDVFVLVGAIIGGVVLAEAFWTVNHTAITNLASRFFRRKSAQKDGGAAA